MRILDKVKIGLALLIFALVLLIPLVVLLVGWSEVDFRTGIIAAAITFAVLLVLAGVLLATVRKQTWFSSTLPLLMGYVYSLLPDVLVGPIDDTVTVSGGALLSFFLWARKQPNMPRWVVWPVIASVVYTALGGWLPGPLDEMLVYLVSGLTTLAGVRKGKEVTQTQTADYIEGEFYEPDEGKR